MTIPAAVIQEDRVVTEAVEINAAAHCNLACLSCSHNSAHASVATADIEQVRADLTSLSKWIRVEHVRVLGGEPLMHPDLPGLLRAIRSTPMGSRIRLISNGLRLLSDAEDVWAAADEIHISQYPATRRFITDHLGQLRTLASTHNTTLVVKEFDRFRVAERSAGSQPELTDLVYRTCQVGNVWRCLTLERGRLYRCPQALYGPSGPQPEGQGLDYLDTDQITSTTQVARWLTGSQPLAACVTCAGSVGRLFDHRQERRQAPNELPQGLDLQALKKLQADPYADSGCVVREHTVWPA